VFIDAEKEENEHGAPETGSELVEENNDHNSDWNHNTLYSGWNESHTRQKDVERCWFCTMKDPTHDYLLAPFWLK